MRHPRHFGAFMSGLALYSAAMVLTGGLAGDAWFFDGREPLAELLGAAAAYALLLFVLALGWGYLTLRPCRHRRGLTMSWCVGGLSLAWLAWLVYGLVRFTSDPPSPELPLGALLRYALMPLMWGVLSGMAVLAGVLLVGVLLERRR